MTQECIDAELIQRFKKSADNEAFQELVNRYYSSILNRFKFLCNNVDDAKDLTQDLWIKIHKNLQNYDEQGKFKHYLFSAANNLVTDYWRKKGRQPKSVIDLDANTQDYFDIVASEDSIEQRLEYLTAVDYLTKKLIPELPCEQRLIFLLKHESEYWEEEQRLEWSHLAELNGLTVAEAWQYFDAARRKLAKLGFINQDVNHDIDQKQIIDQIRSTTNRLSEIELCIFLVWTQAQRAQKNIKFTETDISELLNIPLNTVKARYRYAIQKLQQGLQMYSEVPASDSVR